MKYIVIMRNGEDADENENVRKAFSCLNETLSFMSYVYHMLTEGFKWRGNWVSNRWMGGQTGGQAEA